MNCKYQKIINGEINCSIGWFGTKPSLGDCDNCIKLGKNSLKAKMEAHAIYLKSHPESAPRISGCCDSARNYIE